jgi:hypothetical protein
VLNFKSCTTMGKHGLPPGVPQQQAADVCGVHELCCAHMHEGTAHREWRLWDCLVPLTLLCCMIPSEPVSKSNWMYFSRQAAPTAAQESPAHTIPSRYL